MGNALTPGRPAIRGVISRASCRVLRSRSSQGVALKNTVPWATEGLPTIEKIRSNSGYP